MVKIFVVTHKENPILSNELFIPMQVGNNDNIYPEILRDELDTTSNVKVFNYDPGKTRTSMRALAYPAENPQDLKEPKVLFNDYLWFFSEESQLSKQHYFKFDD